MKEIINIERLALQGEGVGRLSSGGPDDKKVAFVPYTLPGETVEARLVEDKKNYSRWIPTKIETPSSVRVTPRCPVHFSPGSEHFCGGCDWQQLSPDFQKKAKAELVRETLIRLGGIAKPPMNALLSGPQDWHYRNKIQVPFGVGRGYKLMGGFYSPGSHDIVEFDDCVIQPELSVQIFQAVKKFASLAKWHPYEEDRHQGWLRHVLIRTNEAGQALLALVTTSEQFNDQTRFVNEMRSQFPTLVSIHLNVQTGKTHRILGLRWVRLWGDDRLEENILGLRLAYSPGSFFQVNTKAAERLYEEALRQLDPAETSVVLDVYCGVGAMTFLAARKTKFAIGIEETLSSIRDAKWNAQQNQIQNVKFVEGSAEKALAHPAKLWEGYLKQADLFVIVDPPRSGCRPEVLTALIKLGPKRIVYVSCNPATLARDIKILAPHYQLKETTPVDLFPQTSHIESVSRLDRI